MVSTHVLSLFVGAFQFLNLTLTQNGIIVPDGTCDEIPAGVISYTPTGFMSAVLQATADAYRLLDITLLAQE